MRVPPLPGFSQRRHGAGGGSVLSAELAMPLAAGAEAEPWAPAALAIGVLLLLLMAGLVWWRKQQAGPPSATAPGDVGNTEELRRLVEIAPLPAVLLGPGGLFVHFNRPFLETFGYAPSELPDLEAWWTRAYPDPRYRERVIADWCGRLATTTSGNTLPPYESRVACRDSTERTIEWRGIQVGQHTVVLGTDLTERLRASLALRTSEERYRLLLEHAPEAIVIFDVGRGRFVDCNRSAEALFRLTCAELLKKGPVDLSPPTQPGGRPSAELAAHYLREATAGGRPVFEWIHRDSTGRDIPCEVRLLLLHDPEGQPLVRGSILDIGARKLREDALRESEERFRLLIENSTELVAQVDTAGILVYVSPNHLAITGYTPEEMLGRGVFEFIHPDDATNILEAFRTRRDQATRVFRYRFKDGSWHWLESAGRRFRTSGGEEMAAVISRDITERVRSEEARKRLEAQLRQAQKMEAIGTLAGGIAHDFNNILTALFANLMLTQSQLAREDPAQPLLAASYRACERARDLVAKILTFSRRHEPQKALHSLGPILREAAGLLRASLPATIDIRVHDASPSLTVSCDASQIHQVLMNLGANAAHAMRERGGVLTLGLDDAAPHASIAVSHPTLAQQPVARLTVRDTGHGMDNATRERIFEPFFTTKPVGEGTGLGLAVVHGIVEDHGGAIAVESAPGVGTTFRVWLPTADPLPPPVEPDRHATPRGQGERVLFVDDEAAIVEVGSRIVERLGYTVDAFTSASEALTLFLREPAAFDLLVTDLTMPDISGPDLAQQVRAIRPDLPVVVTTGYLRPRDIDAARESGLSHFLEKPFTLETLADSLRQALDAQRAPPVT